MFREEGQNWVYGKKCTVNLRTRENVFCCVFVLLDGPIRKSDQTQKLQSARKAELWAFEELKLTCIRMPFYFLFFLRIWFFSFFSKKLKGKNKKEYGYI